MALAQASNRPQKLSIAEEAFGRSQFDAAEPLYLGVLSDPFAAPKDVSLAKCRLGIIKSIQLNYKDSKRYLDESTRTPYLSGPHKALCDYALLQLHVQDSEWEQAKNVLGRFDSAPANLAPVYMARIWALGTEIGKKSNDPRLEVISLQQLHSVMKVNHIDVVEVKVLNKHFKRSEVAAKLGENVQVSQADPQRARSQSGQDLNTTPAHTEPNVTAHTPQARTTPSSWEWPPYAGLSESAGRERSLRIQRLEKDDPRHMRVGLLLPYGQAFSKFNHRILRGVSAFLASSAAKGVDYKVFIESFDPVKGLTEHACVKLALEHQVHAILGPVSASQTVQAMPCAETFGIPLFPLGPVGYGMEMNGGWMVRPGVLAQSQTRALIKHLSEDLNVKKMQILAPDDAYGIELASALENQARLAQISITQRQHYDMTATVFQGAVAQALGPQDPKSRPDEYKAAVQEAKKLAAEQKRKFNAQDVKLTPLIRFDALFIPDSLARAKMIASTFAYADAKHIRYVGDYQWTEATNGIASLADPFLNGARIPKPAEGKFMGFLKGQLLSQRPSELEKQAFDSLIMLRHAHYKAASANGSLLMHAMKQADFQVEGAHIYGPIDQTGEPSTRFEIQNYRNGTASSQLLPWENPDETKDSTYAPDVHR